MSGRHAPAVNMSKAQDESTVERTETPKLSHASTGVKLVFTEVDGTTNCWLAADPGVCVSEGEWR